MTAARILPVSLLAVLAPVGAVQGTALLCAALPVYSQGLVLPAPASAGSTTSSWLPVGEPPFAGSDSADFDFFGSEVALSGSTLVVGAPRVEASGLQHVGAAYVFERSGGTWVETAKLTPDILEWSLEFGSSVAIDGDEERVVVGARNEAPSGAVYVFRRAGSSWTLEQKLFPNDPMSWGGWFGESVAIAANRIVCGAPQSASTIGAAYVFERIGGVWTQVIKLVPPEAEFSARVGIAVVIEDDTIALGALEDDGSGPGSVYIYNWDSTSWVQGQRLTPSNGSAGDHFGTALELDGDMLAIGAIGEDTLFNGSGAVFLFRLQGQTWAELAFLKASDPGTTDHFGRSVALHEDLLLVGAPGADQQGQFFVGAAYAFSGATGVWTEIDKLMPPTSTMIQFGESIGLDGENLIVGAPSDEIAASYSGGVHPFWLPTPTGAAYCTAGNSSSGCNAAVSAFGSPSASLPSGFFLAANTVEGAKDGMFFYGTNGRQAVIWGTGYQCVVPPVKRGGLLQGLGTSTACDGAFSQDLNALWCPTCPKPLHNPGSGATMQAQFWYRDPWNTATNKGTTMSDAVEFVVAP